MTYLRDDIFAWWHICVMTYLHDVMLEWWHTCVMIYLRNDILEWWHTCVMTYSRDDLLAWWPTCIITYLRDDLLAWWPRVGDSGQYQFRNLRYNSCKYRVIPKKIVIDWYCFQYYEIVIAYIHLQLIKVHVFSFLFLTLFQLIQFFIYF